MQNMILNNLGKKQDFVLENEKTYTYQHLNEFYLAFSQMADDKSIKKILICLRQGFEAYASVISSFLKGITFCSVKYDDPVERIQEICREYQPDLIISEVEREFFNVIGIESFITPKEIREYDVVPLYASVSVNPIAYVMYTSGSAGYPKGVKIRRESFTTVMNWINTTFNIDSSDICSQYANLGFDMSLVDIFLAACAGASLVPFPDYRDKLFPGAKIEKYGITFWNSVPNVIDFWDMQKCLQKGELGTLKKMKFGGAQIFGSQMEKIFTALPDVKIFLSYGPTEVTLFCSCLIIDKSNYKQYWHHSMPLGNTLPGSHITLDNVQNGIGEIVIYGENLGAGFIGRYSREEAFKVQEVNGQVCRTYHSGDYGIYHGGCLYFVGRVDSQIKVNGNRIDLTEIDRVMRDAGCIASHSMAHQNSIYTFYVADEIPVDLLRKKIRQQLPSYLIPDFMYLITSLPFNNNGKVNIPVLIKWLQSEKK